MIDIFYIQKQLNVRGHQVNNIDSI